MAKIEDNSPENTETLPPSAPTKPPPAPTKPQVVERDVEQGTPSASVLKMPVITTSWRREDLYKSASLALRVMGLLFSFLALIIMATNFNDGLNFDDFGEYSYLLAIAVISTLYAGGQVFLQVRELSTGVQRNLALFDFIGDQIAAYLLISAGSAAVPLTNKLREPDSSAGSILITDSSSAGSTLFTDSSSAAIAMVFIAFFVLALSALVSGYRLSHQSFI